MDVLFIAAIKKQADVNKIAQLCLKLMPNRGTALKPLRIMIMGIPNVGKSTLMNALLKKRVAKVGDEPAVTKTQQRLYLGNNIVLIDTPGMMWPKIEHPSDGLMLAASHAIGSNALIEEEVATFLADMLLMRYAPLIVQQALALILVAKLLKRRVPKQAREIYQEFVTTPHVTEKSQENRRRRGRKIVSSAQGNVYDLDEFFGLECGMATYWPGYTIILFVNIKLRA